jgi:hypothetical protein
MGRTMTAADVEPFLEGGDPVTRFAARVRRHKLALDYRPTRPQIRYPQRR